LQVCCTSIVYATDKKQTKVEFPEARIYEEAMNILLFEEKTICPQCGSDAKTCAGAKSVAYHPTTSTDSTVVIAVDERDRFRRSRNDLKPTVLAAASGGGGQ
jgi:hypothetical protein